MLRSPVEANGDFEFLVFFARKLNVVRIAIDIPLISAADVHIIATARRIIVAIVRMNDVEIVLRWIWRQERHRAVLIGLRRRSRLACI